METDLTQSQFILCDLNQAVFERTNLEKVDFRSGFNFNIDPEANNIKQAKFSSQGLTGLLMKYNIVVD